MMVQFAYLQGCHKKLILFKYCMFSIKYIVGSLKKRRKEINLSLLKLIQQNLNLFLPDFPQKLNFV